MNDIDTVKLCGRLLSVLRSGGIFILLGLGRPALAEDHWLASESGCRVWSDKPLEQGEVVRWTGGCEDEKLSGKGVLTVLAGDKTMVRFEGEMRGGKAQGPGTMEMTTDEGQVRYQGGFADSLLDGYGVLELADGSRYEGGFQTDKPHGYGVYKAADGSLYQGEIKQGLPHGTGYDVFADGEKYHGGFQEGQRHGEGILLLPSGDAYQGGFSDGRADGSGVFTDASGTVYRGTWSAGHAQGTFTVTKPDGSQEEQVWKSDKRILSGSEES